MLGNLLSHVRRICSPVRMITYSAHAHLCQWLCPVNVSPDLAGAAQLLRKSFPLCCRPLLPPFAVALCCRPCAADVEWNERYLLRAEGGYVPRFKLETAVLRVPVVPGSDPRIAYGDLFERGGYRGRGTPVKLLNSSCCHSSNGGPCDRYPATNCGYSNCMYACGCESACS